MFPASSLVNGPKGLPELPVNGRPRGATAGTSAFLTKSGYEIGRGSQ